MQYPEFRAYIGISDEKPAGKIKLPGKQLSKKLEALDLKSLRIILKNNKPYSKIQYRTEKELEVLGVHNITALFGNDVIYFDSKKVVTSNAKISAVPDGLLLTMQNIQNARLWLVEYELSRHDLHNHVLPQILKFMRAIKNESTKKSIKELMYQKIRENPESIKKIKSILPSKDEEIHPFLESVLDRELGVIIVIDKKTPQIEEVLEEYRTEILEFITFRNNRGDKIYLIDTFKQPDMRLKK
jgi:hypothetical protein